MTAGSLQVTSACRAQAGVPPRLLPLINLMGLMTFFEDFFFEILDHFWPLRKQFWRLRGQNLPFAVRGTKEFRNRHFK